MQLPVINCILQNRRSDAAGGMGSVELGQVGHATVCCGARCSWFAHDPQPRPSHSCAWFLSARDAGGGSLSTRPRHQLALSTPHTSSRAPLLILRAAALPATSDPASFPSATPKPPPHTSLLPRHPSNSQVVPGSGLVGKSIQHAGLRGIPGLFLVSIDRQRAPLPLIREEEAPGEEPAHGAKGALSSGNGSLSNVSCGVVNGDGLGVVKGTGAADPESGEVLGAGSSAGLLGVETLHAVGPDEVLQANVSGVKGIGWRGGTCGGGNGSWWWCG